MQRWAMVREQRRPNSHNEDAADGGWEATIAGERRGAKSSVAGGEIEERGGRFPMGEMEEGERGQRIVPLNVPYCPVNVIPADITGDPSQNFTKNLFSFFLIIG